MEIDAPERDAPGDGPIDVIDDPAAAAPAVVAVVVAHDPGPWFEECLRSLGAQDYPSLSVLVVDAGSDEPVAARVAAELPAAYLRRLEENPGVSAASNEVLAIVDGAAFYLLCHDDVALDAGAVRALVEEAYRSNAGVVGPKLVSWDDTRRLLQVGMRIDKTGHEVPTVERGELDQEQHDAVSDVFCVPGGVTLVRADLFATLGGYDPAVTFLGEDLDLCWRAQVAGARVLVAPAAVARHLEALGLRGGFDPDTRRRLTLRHRLRAVLTCYGPWHRLRVLPQIALLSAIEVVYAFVAGRRRLAADLVDSWRWNRRNRAGIRVARARVAASRAIPDVEIRRLQARGSARLAAFLRGQLGRGGDDLVRSLTRSACGVAGSLRRGPLRTVAATWAGIVLLVVVGSRHHLWSTPPALVDLPQLPVRPWPVLAEWLSGWRRSGLGGEAPQPTAYGLLGVAGTVLLGSMGLLRRLLVVAPLLLGPLGLSRLAARTGSRRAALAGAVAYAVIPVPYDALAEGRWGAVLAWAAMPWIVAGVLPPATGVQQTDRSDGPVHTSGGSSATGVQQTDRSDGPVHTSRAGSSPWWRPVVGVGLLTAAVSAFVPLALGLPLLAALAVAVGGVVAGRPGGGARALAIALGAVLLAVVLHLPWALEFVVPGASWAPVGGVASSIPAPSIAELLRFETGPVGAAPLGWAPLVAAALPLVIARSWRLTWAVRAWTLALLGWALAVAVGAADVEIGTGPVELLLAPAACGLAIATALGVAAFEFDLRGYRFGWRQVVSGLAGLALAAAALPVLNAALDGRWDSPARGTTDVLAFLDTEQESAGPFRTLWLGDPAVLPVAAWELDPGVGWALTEGGVPTVLDRWSGSPDGATELAADALDLAASGQTSRLGRLLAPMGVRYLIVVEADRAVAGERVAVPQRLASSLGEQLDLAEVEIDANLHVYRNAAWFPVVAGVGSLDHVASGDGYLRSAARRDLSGASRPMRADGSDRYEGDLTDERGLWFSASSASGWELEVDGERAPSTDAFVWGTAFAVDGGGEATLEYTTPLSRLFLSGVQAAAWALAAYALWRTRNRRTGVQ